MENILPANVYSRQNYQLLNYLKPKWRQLEVKRWATFSALAFATVLENVSSKSYHDLEKKRRRANIVLQFYFTTPNDGDAQWRECGNCKMFHSLGAENYTCFCGA